MPTPIDFRSATFAGLKDRLEGLRRLTYQAWVEHGPGTTREVARASCIDLLTLRPRTTELVKVGLVRCVGGAGHDGIYEATPVEAWEAWRAERVEGQLVMAL